MGRWWRWWQLSSSTRSTAARYKQHNRVFIVQCSLGAQGGAVGAQELLGVARRVHDQARHLHGQHAYCAASGAPAQLICGSAHGPHQPQRRHGGCRHHARHTARRGRKPRCRCNCTPRACLQRTNAHAQMHARAHTHAQTTARTHASQTHTRTPRPQ